MTMKTYSVTLRDGSTESRKSARPYTHAISVEYTQVYLDSVVGRYEREIAADTALIASLVDQAATEADAAAYAAAEARRAYLNELVPYTFKRHDGTVDTSQKARWLSDEFNPPGGAYSSRDGLDQVNKADAAIMATAQGRINRARANIELAQKAIERSREQIVVGSCFVSGWSMSFRNAQKAADKAHASYPGCVVGVSADIRVREHGTRAPKIVIKVPAGAEPTDTETSARVHQSLTGEVL